MEAQHNGDGWFDGLDASVEIPLDAGDSGTAKANIRVSTPALYVLVLGGLGAAVILSKGPGLERVQDALPALVERVGERLLAAA
jgi:hypothetical protein